MTHDLNSRHERARQLRKEGYNCAQSVLMVFDDITGLDEATACRLASGLGAGIGASREICGVPNAMAIVQGFRLPATAQAKPLAMKRAGALLQKFKAITGGRLRCVELKSGADPVPCDRLILDGIEILHNYLLEEA